MTNIFCYVEHTPPGGIPAPAEILEGTVDVSDTLTGGDGDDTLRGSSGPTPEGNTEEDILTGGAGADKFVLGDETGVFYNQNGFLDCAIIKDFSLSDGDQIQLAGVAGDYTLNAGTNAFGDDFTEIFQNGEPDRLS